MDTNRFGGAEIAIFVVIGLVYLAVLVVTVWAYVNIVRRAGYSGWWVLIGLVPIANIVMFCVFAFKEWPVQRELAALRAAVSGQGGPYGAPGYGSSGYGPPAP